jgi:nucleoside-diphosphate-sugar epimerase
VTDQTSFTPGPLDRDATFYVAGHRGLVGSAIWRKLKSEGFTNMVGATHAEVDLKDRPAVFDYVNENKPKYLVLAAAKVGGILANNTYPVDFLTDNLQMQVNVLDAALESGVERVLFMHLSGLGSPTHQGGIPPNGSPGADERRLRNCKNSRDFAYPICATSVRSALDIRDAHQPVWAG